MYNIVVKKVHVRYIIVSSPDEFLVFHFCTCTALALAQPYYFICFSGVEICNICFVLEKIAGKASGMMDIARPPDGNVHCFHCASLTVH